MIVYAGKQFWNDFNNGDEALFQDANRPRDNDKFKIRPWLQSDKWDFRSGNKNIYTLASNLRASWLNSVAHLSWYKFPEDLTIPTLKELQKSWDPWCIVKNGNIEIVESGTYIVQAFAEFIYPWALSNGYQYIETVELLEYDTEEWKWGALNMNQARACWDKDQLLTWQVWWYEKWTIFNMWAGHTYWSNVEIYQVLNIQRLA